MQCNSWISMLDSCVDSYGTGHPRENIFFAWNCKYMLDLLLLLILLLLLLLLLKLADLSPRRPGFNPRPGHVGFMVDKVF